MKTILIISSAVVIGTLLSYSVAIIDEQKKRRVTKLVLMFLTTGIILDITATSMMIIGSEDSMFTLHSMLRYSALTLMFIDTILIWRFRLSKGSEEEVPRKLHLYSRYAYLLWCAAFMIGSILVILR